MNNETLQTLVPGGLSAGTPKQGTPRPYGIIRLQHLNQFFTSGNRTVTKYRIIIRIFSTASLNLADNICNAMSNLFDFNRCGLDLGINTKILVILPDFEQIEEPQESPLGDDMAVFNMSWTLRLNEFQPNNFTSR